MVGLRGVPVPLGADHQLQIDKRRDRRGDLDPVGAIRAVIGGLAVAVRRGGRHQCGEAVYQFAGRHPVGQRAISITLGTLAAYALSRFTFRFLWMRNSDITFFFISQRIMPPIVLAIPFFLMLRWLGLLDSLPGLILVYVALLMPIAVWVMVDFFNGVPRGLDEMAWMDGCNPITTFWRVILPNALPGLVVAGMFCIIFGWNDFFFAFTLTFTQTQLLPVAIVSLNSSVTPWWSLSAAALVSIAPLVVLAFVVERFLSKGGLAGAVR